MAGNRMTGIGDLGRWLAIAVIAGAAFLLPVRGDAACPAGNEGDGCSVFCPCKGDNTCGIDFICHPSSCPAGNDGDGCSAFCPCKSPNTCGLDFKCHAPCSYCTSILGTCCGDEGQLSCAGFGVESGCNYACKDGLRFEFSSGTCQPFNPDCSYCQSTFDNCCGGLGDTSCAGTGERASGSCNFECAPDLDLRNGICQELCSYCSSGFGNCCGDVGQVSCAGFFPEPGMSDTCNATCKDGACFDGGKATCQACDSCDDDSVFTLGPCGKSYQRTCNTATLQKCPACEDDYKFDLAGTFVATSLCQPTWREPEPEPPQTGFDFTFAVVGDVHVGDIPRSYCSPQSAYGVMTTMVNTLGSSGLTWPSGSVFSATAGQPIGEPLAVVMTGDMTHRDGSTTDLVNYSDERKDFQDYWDERRDDTKEGDGPSVNYTVYPGLGNHDRIVCNVEEIPWDYLTVFAIFDTNWWNDLECAIRSSTKNTIMNEYMDFRMEDAPGVNYDETSKNYSWDWGPFHLIQGNTWAGARDSLAWLEDDLATNVGSSGKPVILFQHYGWDSFSTNGGSDDPANGTVWWSSTDRQALKDALQPYNVVAIFTGHVHSPDFIKATDSDGPGYDVYTTDDGGDDDECGAVTRQDTCTQDSDCDDNFSGTSEFCKNDGKCKYEDSGDGTIKGDGGIMVVRLRDLGNCEAAIDIAEFQWTEDDTDAGDMTLMAAGFGSPTSTKTINYCNLPPVAQCKDVTVSANTTDCTANASVNDGSYDPDGGAPTCTANPSQPYGLGDTTVMLDCEDPLGLKDSCVGKVTVEDNDPPSIVAPADLMAVECTSSAPSGASPSIGNATAPDACDPNPTVTDDAPSLFPLGTTLVTWTATDASTNSSNATQSVEVVDTRKPSITPNPGPSVLECSVQSYVEPGATASDVCDADVPVSIAGSVDDTMVGNYAVTYDAQDDSATPLRRKHATSRSSTR